MINLFVDPCWELNLCRNTVGGKWLCTIPRPKKRMAIELATIHQAFQDRSENIHDNYMCSLRTWSWTLKGRWSLKSLKSTPKSDHQTRSGYQSFKFSISSSFCSISLGAKKCAQCEPGRSLICWCKFIVASSGRCYFNSTFSIFGR